MTPRWLDIARRYDGLAEVAGAGSNPVILAWINGNGRPDAQDDSTISWCGFFMAGVFTEAGLGQVIPREPGAAKSWRACGVPLDGPRDGCIVVMPRYDRSNPDAAHVGIVTAWSASAIKVLAGNQGNRVSTATYLLDDSFVYRWPLAEATPAQLAASGSRIAAAAQRQKRDAAVSGTASGSTQILPAADMPPPGSPAPGVLDGIRTGLDGVLGDVAWAKATAARVLDFAAFAGVHWRWVALGVAAYYGLRFVYDSHMIGLWRAQDHNTGKTQSASQPAAFEERAP